MFSTKPEEENCCSTDTVGSDCSLGSKSNAHDCCTPQPKGKTECPQCHDKAKGVLGKTLEHLLTEKAKTALTCFDGFYYCKTATCKVIYFRNNEILTQKEMSIVVGLKEGVVPATVCYCFDWTKERIKADLDPTGSTKVIEDIKAKMINPGCSCEILNPSAGCCLGDVGKAVKDIKKELGL